MGVLSGPILTLSWTHAVSEQLTGPQQSVLNSFLNTENQRGWEKSLGYSICKTDYNSAHPLVSGQNGILGIKSGTFFSGQYL